MFDLSRQILTLAKERNIALSAVHIQGRKNVTADLLSRTPPVITEWTLQKSAFMKFQRFHKKKLEIDFFTTPENAQP